MTFYRPVLVRQADGSTFQWFNCTMASAAMALDRATEGAKKSTGAKMRSCQDNQSGGTTLEDAKTALERCYGQTLDNHYGLSWATFIAALKFGHGAIIQGWYSYFGSYASQINRSFNHAVFCNEVSADGSTLLIYDPLAIAAKWIPVSVVQQFCGHLALGEGGTPGVGNVYAGFTIATPDHSVPVPPPPTPVVKLLYGGVALSPIHHYQTILCNQRRSPYIRPDNIVRMVPAGTPFTAYQKTTKGTNVSGSSTWYGNMTGTIWYHSSVLK